LFKESFFIPILPVYKIDSRTGFPHHRCWVEDQPFSRCTGNGRSQHA